MSNILYIEDHTQEILPPMSPAQQKIRLLWQHGEAIETLLLELSQEDLRQLRTAQVPSRDGKTYITGIEYLCQFAVAFRNVSGNIFTWVETVAFKLGMGKRLSA